MDHDPNLAIEIQHDIAELGGSFVCTVDRGPTDGETNAKTVGQVRGVQIALVMETEGRGDVDTKRIGETILPVDEYGMASGTVTLDVPIDSPISYDGALMRIVYRIEARTDIRLGRDQRSSAEVLVVPVGGAGVYRSAHPLR